MNLTRILTIPSAAATDHWAVSTLRGRRRFSPIRRKPTFATFAS